MNRECSLALAATMSMALLLPVASMASEQGNAEQLCKSQIRDAYGVSNFRNVWSETEGNHKFRVHGQVKMDNHKYDFNCKIKHGNVKSYAYDGPHQRHSDKDDDSGIGTAVAVGAGLAINAALAASQAGDDKHRDTSSSRPVSKSVLEDDCHDMLQYRIRDEHDYTARVTLKDSKIEGHYLVGDAKVQYDRERPHHATYTCHFDSRGRVQDSRYHLY